MWKEAVRPTQEKLVLTAVFWGVSLVLNWVTGLAILPILPSEAITAFQQDITASMPALTGGQIALFLTLSLVSELLKFYVLAVVAVYWLRHRNQ